jgi:putative endonuclease
LTAEPAEIYSNLMESYVYILASQRNGTLYIGLTSDIIRRVWEHKNKFVSGFTAQYNVNLLVYYEIFSDIQLAAAREKRLKEWKRQWKIDLIQKMNPDWNDLYYEITQ